MFSKSADANKRSEVCCENYRSSESLLWDTYRMTSSRTPPPSLSSDIASQIEADIKQGRLLPGQPLDERMLAERFGVSRTPVRAAVHQLAARGLLKVAPRQGLQVARASLGELREMFEVLAELEGACAKLAARRIDDPWRSRMSDAQALCAQAAERNDVDGYTRANADFHEALYQGCRNRYLADQICEIRARTSVYTVSVFQLPGRMRQSAQDHAAIVAAVLEGDGAAAQRAMVDHVGMGGLGFADFVSMLPPDATQAHTAHGHPRGHARGLEAPAATKPPV